MDKLNNIPIYWINLDRSNIRKNRTQKLFGLHPNNRISAIDGSNLNFDKILLPNNYIGSKYELACTCSHLKAIYMAYISMEELVIISEDDVDISLMDKWNMDMCQMINLAPSDWEILQLNTSDPDAILLLFDLYKLNNNNLLSRWVNYSSTVIYAINRIGMKNIIDKFIKYDSLKGIIYDFTSENNLLADYLIYTHMNTYTINKPIFNYFSIDSNIHTDHLYFQNNVRNLISKVNSLDI